MRHTDISLADFSTFRLGGQAALLVDCTTEDELVEAVRSLRQEHPGHPPVLIGGGSNILFSDHGYAHPIVRYRNPEAEVTRDGETLSVSGAATLDDLAKAATEAGLGGLTCCSGIPGTVGGAIVGNAGAWGKQIGDVVSSLRLLTPDGTVEERRWFDIGFSYRNSSLKQSGDIVLSATFTLEPAQVAGLVERRAEILQLRSEKHPDLAVEPCIGSIFRNIEPTSDAGRRQATGWFLDQVGGRKLKVGGAHIFKKHANIIVAGPGCKAQDVHDLSLQMAALAKENFGLDLVREVRFLGAFDGAGDHAGFF